MLREQFKKYLIDRGYKEYTPSGNPSTVYDYLKRIDFVINHEKLNSWSEIEKNINFYLKRYGETGELAHLGRISHNSVISALIRFDEFLKDFSR